MCGRFTHKFTWRQIHTLLNLTLWPDQERYSYNVAPSQQAPVVRSTAGGGELVFLRWGLVPAWAKDPSAKNQNVNAKAETASTKPSFRAAFAKRRCIVPVSGFYEWQKTGGKAKQPWYIYRADGQPMLLAGVWESWTPAEGEPEERFAILTVGPNSAMAAIHDRMPAVLEPEQAPKWLDAGTDKETATAMLAPAADGVLAMHPVSTRVNKPENDSADLIGAVDAVNGVVASEERGLFDA